jgi:hypothetical protein
MELKKFGFLAYQLCYLQPSSVILYVFFCCIYAKEFCLQAHDVHGDDKIEEVSSADKSERWARVTFKIVLSCHGGSF